MSVNLEVGSTIGDYEVISILGAGGMGKVYKVRNTISDRVEAMKVLLPDLAGDPDLADRFVREIKVQASLEHPNIASLHTAVRVDNQLLMLMEFVEGITLEQELRRAPLAVPAAVDYIRQVLGALEYAHARGVIHRDIKPANMMLTPSGVVKLMDFGIAKAAGDRHLTMTGATMGSLYYMSPEQIQGNVELDTRSDLYSMGVSLYELVTGKQPFDGDSQYAIMSAHLESTPKPPIELDPRMPQLLSDVIMMAVLKDPNARFQSAGAFRNALGNVLTPAVQPVEALTRTMGPPAEAVVPAPARAPRGKRGIWMAVGAIAAMLALVAVLEFGPKKGAIAAPQTTTQQTETPPVTTPPEATQPVATQPAADAPGSAPAVAPVGAPAEPAPGKQVQARPPATAKPALENPPSKAVAREPAVQQPSIPQPATPQPSVQQAAPPPSAPPAESAAVRRELEHAREQLTQLNSRATNIRGTLQRMERDQAAMGHGLNAALSGPANLMNGYLDQAANDLNAGDAASAKSNLEKAERQIDKLAEKLNQ